MTGRYAVALLLACAGAPAMAQDTYLDDRSTPDAVIRSLYNAVNTQQYPRAWSYFEDGHRPEFGPFADGYGDTVHVEVRTGEVFAEGAAGTTYWQVPTVIEARRTDGSVVVFAGCYTLTQASPYAYDRPPYDPIAIRDGTLVQSDKHFADASGDCPG
ncbi:hypothetical protein HKCCE2091_09465 [Rhodobacterales bacterium HKCCE2091]|nr:hypothetical protein [Rhodobacterales bacterium HKCCE2091]